MGEPFTAWVADGLTKIFADTGPGPDADTTIELHGARGECEVAQIAVRAGPEDICMRTPLAGKPTTRARSGSRRGTATTRTGRMTSHS